LAVSTELSRAKNPGCLLFQEHTGIQQRNELAGDQLTAGTLRAQALQVFENTLSVGAQAVTKPPQERQAISHWSQVNGWRKLV
jgi:hypothetical protein